mgnify:CR=1 FL=1
MGYRSLKYTLLIFQLHYKMYGRFDDVFLVWYLQINTYHTMQVVLELWIKTLISYSHEMRMVSYGMQLILDQMRNSQS